MIRRRLSAKGQIMDQYIVSYWRVGMEIIAALQCELMQVV